MTISLITGETLDQTLNHLDQLRQQGQAMSVTDEAGVMRWSLVPVETGAAMELGAEVWLAGHYEPSPSQMERLGFDH